MFFELSTTTVGIVARIDFSASKTTSSFMDTAVDRGQAPVL
jgi:hypothetical protein